MSNNETQNQSITGNMKDFFLDNRVTETVISSPRQTDDAISHSVVPSSPRQTDDAIGHSAVPSSPRQTDDAIGHSTVPSSPRQTDDAIGHSVQTMLQSSINTVAQIAFPTSRKRRKDRKAFLNRDTDTHW